MGPATPFSFIKHCLINHMLFCDVSLLCVRVGWGGAWKREGRRRRTEEGGSKKEGEILVSEEKGRTSVSECASRGQGARIGMCNSAQSFHLRVRYS